MKSFKNILGIIILSIFFSNVVYSAVPRYKLTVTSFVFSPDLKTLEFDIYIKNISPVTFIFDMGQFIFNVNDAFVNGGSLTYSLATQPTNLIPVNPPNETPILPPSLVPSEPAVYQNHSQGDHQIRVRSIHPLGPETSPVISSTGLGTFVVRMKLTNTEEFVQCGPSLTWREGNGIGLKSGGIYTKIIAYNTTTDLGENITMLSGNVHEVAGVNLATVTVTAGTDVFTCNNLYTAFDHINNNSSTYSNQNVLIEIQGTTLEPQSAVLNTNGEFRTCKIRPLADAVVSPCGPGITDLIVLDGADTVTLDGNVNGDRTLTLDGQGKVATCLKMINGAENNKLLSVISQGATGENIYIAGSVAPAITGNKNNKIENCKIIGGTFGIKIDDNNTFSNDNNKIIADSVNNCKTSGISVSGNALNTLIKRNEIFNTSVVSTTAFTAIEFFGNGNGNLAGDTNLVVNNKIFDLNFDNTLTGIFGINIRPSSQIATIVNVNNNFITLGKNLITGQIMGIRTFPLNIQNFTENIYYNSVFIGGTASSSGQSFGIIMTQINSLQPTVIYNQKNNISINKRTGGSINLASSIDPNGGLTLNADYNCYGATPTGNIAAWFSTHTNDLCAYRTAAGTQEQNTIFKDVDFFDESIGDLHLDNLSKVDFDLVGIPIDGIPGDIDLPATTRDLSYPFKGADEESTSLSQSGIVVIKVLNLPDLLFPNLKSAFNEINTNASRYDSKDVAIEINGNTFEPGTAVLNAGDYNRVEIKPNVDVTVSPSPYCSGITDLIVLDGADTVSFNGIISGSIDGARRLTFDGKGTVATCLKMINGAVNNKLISIISKYAAGENILIANSVITSGTGNNNNKIERCNIVGGTYGIRIYNDDAFFNENNKIITDSVNNCTEGGIAVQGNVLNTEIRSNEIFNTSVVTADYFSAIIFTGYGNGNSEGDSNKIIFNKIYDLNFGNTLQTISGINISQFTDIPTTLHVNNNFVSLGVNLPYTENITGIRTITNDIVNFTEYIYFNSIYIGGSLTSGSGQSIGIKMNDDYPSQLPVLYYNQLNNISVNHRTGGAGNLASEILFVSGLTGHTVDYNCYWTSGSAIAGWQGTQTDDETAYRAAALTQEQHTFFKSNVSFLNELSGDLHLDVNSYDDIQLAGKKISGITADIDDLLIRNGLQYPYRGADEVAGHPLEACIVIVRIPNLDHCFPDLKSAFDWIFDNQTIYSDKDVEVIITENTTETATAELKAITPPFKSCRIIPLSTLTAEVSVTGSSPSVDPVIKVNGAKHVMFDGFIDINLPKGLKIIGEGDCIKMIDGASDNSVRNLTSKSVTGNNIFIAESILPANTNNNDTIANCKIDGGNTGIYVKGHTNLMNSGTVIRQNEIINSKRFGIYAGINTQNNSIDSNSISLPNPPPNPGPPINEFTGISCAGVGMNNISKNKIFNFTSLVPGIYYFGIYTAPNTTSGGVNNTTNNITNNFVSITNDPASYIYGIHCTGGNVTQTTNVNHNSVYIGKIGTSTSGFSIGIEMAYSGNGIYNQFNNISVNERSTSANQTNLAFETSIPSGVSINTDFNCYWALFSKIAGWGSNPSTNDLCTYRTAAVTEEQNTIFKDVFFINKAGGDLHLDGTSIGDFELAGIPVGVEGDIDDFDIRQGLLYPYRGAHEASPLALSNFGIVDVIINTGTRTFPNLKSAFDEINANVCQRYSGKDVTVVINANTTETATAQLNEISPPFTSCLVIPLLTSSSEISVTGAVSPLIQLNGAKHVTFDGYLSSAIPKGLIINGSGDCIKMIDGASDNEFKNLTSESAGGNNIHIAGSASSGGNDRNKIENCLIKGGTAGVKIIGSSSYVNDNNTIINNTINNCSAFGVDVLQDTKNTNIETNEIFFDVSVNTASEFIAIRNSGFEINNIIRNKIHNLSNSTTSSNIVGIKVVHLVPSGSHVGDATYNIINNFVSIIDNNASQILGIYATKGGAAGMRYTANVNHNTVYIGGNAPPAFYSICLWEEDLPDNSEYNQFNNILINERTGYYYQIACDIFQADPSHNILYQMDYNCYWSTFNFVRHNSLPNSPQYNINWTKSITSYQSAAYPNEKNTIFKNVNFIAPATGDLHLKNVSPNNSIGDYDLIGTPLTSVTSDIDGVANSRDLNVPYMGADESDDFEFNGTIKIRAYIDNYPLPLTETLDIEVWECNATGRTLEKLGPTYHKTFSSNGIVTIECPEAKTISSSNKFYIVLKHQYAIETWSKDLGETFTTVPGEYLEYNFTTGADKAFANNMKTCFNKAYIFYGDTDGDGSIDYSNDVTSTYAAAYFPTTDPKFDMDFNLPIPTNMTDVRIVNETQTWFPLIISDPTINGAYTNRPAEAGSGYDDVDYLTPDANNTCDCNPVRY